MRKGLVLLYLLALLSIIIITSCVVTEPPDFGVAYAGWVDLFVTNYSSQDVGVKYYLFVVDKDKSNIYTVSSSSWVVRANSDKWLVHDPIGLDASYYFSNSGIFLSDGYNTSTNIRKILLSNNITNLMISFLLEVTKGSSEIVFTGFDSSITNITNLNANVYGLGYFDGTFDMGYVITNILKIDPLVSQTDTYYAALVDCNFDVRNDSINIEITISGKGDIVTNIPF
jgi:hypothetical protein